MNEYRKSYQSMIESYLTESENNKKNEYDALTKYPDTLYEAIYHKDKLVYLMKCIECLSCQGSLLEQSVMESLPDKIPYKEDTKWKVPSFTPSIPFNPDMFKNDNHFTYIYREDTKEYFRNLRSLLEEYEQNPNNETARKIIENGWFVTSDPHITGERIKLARQLQADSLEQFNFKEIQLDEFSTDMEIEDNKDIEFYPIYILLNCDENGDNIFRMGLCIDNNFATIYSVSDERVTTRYLPIQVETIDDFKSHGDILIIKCFYLDKSLYDNLSYKIRWLVNNPDTLDKYNNLFRFCRADIDIELNHKLIVAQLIQLCVKIINIDFKNGTNKDIYRMDNPNVYRLYIGLSKDFIPRNISNMTNIIESVFNQYNPKRIITESKVINNIFSYKIENLHIKTDNKKINSLLEEVMDMLSPTSAIVPERDDSGYLEIPENIKTEVDKSYELLSTYNHNDIQGVKQELARLFYLNSVLEQQIKSNSNKDTPEYRAMIDLRTRILSIFHTYFKIVKVSDLEFNFINYMMNSEYKDKKVVIDKKTFKYDGKNIRKYIDMMKAE